MILENYFLENCVYENPQLTLLKWSFEDHFAIIQYCYWLTLLLVFTDPNRICESGADETLHLSLFIPLTFPVLLFCFPNPLQDGKRRLSR